jgi:hypothetical protein
MICFLRKKDNKKINEMQYKIKEQGYPLRLLFIFIDYSESFMLFEIKNVSCSMYYFHIIYTKVFKNKNKVLFSTF